MLTPPRPQTVSFLGVCLTSEYEYMCSQTDYRETKFSSQYQNPKFLWKWYFWCNTPIFYSNPESTVWMVSVFLWMAIPILTTRIRKVGSRINEVGPRIDKVGPRINKRGIRIKNQESGKARNNEWGRASYMCARPLINIWSAPYHHSTNSFFNQFQPCHI